MASTLTELTDGLSTLCGFESQIAEAMSDRSGVTRPGSRGKLQPIRSAFAIALHMHQPLIPAGGGNLQQAAIIGNLQFMMEHPEIKDSHNAPVFRSCYERMGTFVPELLGEGMHPRVMLDYSGCLLFGLRQMGEGDVLERLKPLAQDPAYRSCVEWLGTAWGHAVAPSTPVQDFRSHVRAWQHHFAAIFGLEALSRVRGFSPPEMALPNHPEVAYEFVKTLNDCGYRWVLVQEHSVEQIEDGGPIRRPHLPHRLIVKNTRGETQSILAIIKTQGSDNKLVAQMQPYYEARGLSRVELGGQSVPPLVTQIGDGENGGVMMNEFPPMFLRTSREASGSDTPPVNVTEYLDYLFAGGVNTDDLPAIQPIHQKRIRDRLSPTAGPAQLAEVIAQLRAEDNRFHVDGGSWTGDISWVRGYENVLGPMAAASALFAQKTAQGFNTTHPQYRNALFHLLNAQTSCFRYWGQGEWTDYGREICRRTIAILESVS